MKIILCLALCFFLASAAQTLTADDIPAPTSSDDTSTQTAPDTTVTTPIQNTTSAQDSTQIPSLNVTVTGDDGSKPQNLTIALPDDDSKLFQEVLAALANLTVTASSNNGSSDAAQINPDICGRRTTQKSSLWKRFVSSKRSNQKDWGWLVLLQGTDGVIAGTLINSQWVLTRARGIDSLQTAVVGAPIHMQTRNIAITVAHKDFDPVTRANDIGLIKLDKPVVYSEFTVPVCLPDPDNVDYLGVDGMVATFVVHNDAVDSEELRKSEKSLAILNNERCTSKLNTDDINFNATIQICSLHESKDAVNEVQPVDLGAAVTIKQDDDKWYAIGVASSAWVWSNEFNYIIYSRVSSYIPWILNVIQN